MKKRLLFSICVTLLAMVTTFFGCKKDSDAKSDDVDFKPPVSTFRSENKMIQSLYQSDKVHIFDAVVMVAEDDVTEMSIDTTNMYFSLTFKNDAPKIQRGNVVYIDVQGVPTVVLVLNAETNGKTIDMYGALGDLSYIFHDTELIFETYDSDSISGSNVFAPIKSAVSTSKTSLLSSDDYKWDEETTEHIFDMKKPINRTATFLDDNKIIFSIDKLKYDNICKLTFTSSMSEIFENLNLKYSTGRGDNQSLDNHFKKVAFECAKEKIYRHTHVVDAQYSVQFILNRGKADALSEKEKKKGPEVLYTTPDDMGRYVFPIIGPVHFGFDVLFDPDVNLSLDLSYTHSQRIYGPYIQTTKYIRNKSNEYDEIEEEPINGIKADTPNIPQELFGKSENAFGVDVKGDAKFNFPCIFHVSWLDKRALGVGIALIPYLDIALGGYLGIRDYYGDVKSFYGLFEFGVDWKVALYRTTLIGKEVQFPISIGDWKFDFSGNITKWSLMKFPYKLRTTVGTKKTDLESILIKFEVGKPLRVKYETLTEFIGGYSESVFAGNWIYISDKNGVIFTPEFSTSKEVSWTPKSKDDFLMATIFGERGEVVYSSTIKYDSSNDDNTEIIPSDEPDDPNDNPTPEVKKPSVHFHLSDRGYQPQGRATETREQGADGYFWATATPSNSTIVVTVNGKQWSGSKVYYKDLDVKKNTIEVTASNNGIKGSDILYIEITPKEEPAPQITSVKLNGVKVSNGGSITVKKGEQCKVEVLTNTSCEKISGSIGSTSSYVNNQSSFTDSFSCSERGQYKVTATNGNKTATFTFEVVAEDNSPAPQITSVKVNGSSVSEGKTLHFDYDERWQVAVTTDVECEKISIEVPDNSKRSKSNSSSYSAYYDATESGTVTITATNNGKTAQFVFYIDVEEYVPEVKAPEFTNANISSYTSSSGIQYGDIVYIIFETNETCAVEVYIDGILKKEFSRTSGDRYQLPTTLETKKYTVELVAKSLQDPSKMNKVSTTYTVEDRVYKLEDAGGLTNSGAQKKAHNYWLCNDLDLQSAENANFEGSYWVYSNGLVEYNTLGVSKKSGVFSSKQIRLIVSTSITDLSDKNIVAQKEFQGGDKEYTIDITPTSKQLYLIVYVGGNDCGSMAIDGYYCGPFYYHNAN